MAKKRAIVLIAVGELSLNQIKWAKELGLITIVTDRNPNAKSLKMADIPIVANGKDAELIINRLKNIRNLYNIIGVYSDIDLAETVSKISEFFNAPNISVTTAKHIENKLTMKRVLERENIPTARYKTARNFDEAIIASRSIKMPLVIKPPHSSGAQGVTIVKSSKDFKKAFLEAKKFTDSTVIIEEFLEGSLHDVNILICNGDFYKAGISDRFPNRLPQAYHTGSIDPSQLGRKTQDTIYKYTYLAAKAFNIKFGPFKADIILTKIGPKIIEVAPRFHGDIITSLTTPLARGIKPIWVYFELLAKGKVDKNKFKPSKHNFAGFTIIKAKPGVLLGIKNLKKVSEINGVCGVFFKKKVGNIINSYKNNDDVVGFIVASSASLTKLKETLEKAERELIAETK